MSDFNDNPYFELFSKQQQNQFAIGNSTYKQRLKKLNTLQYTIEVTYREQIQKALQKDLG